MELQAASKIKSLIPEGDLERVRALERHNILASPSENSLRNIAETAALVFDVPIGIISFVDAERVFFKENYGGPLTGTSIERNRSLCSVVVLNDGPTIFKDLHKNPCHYINPDFIRQLGVRFYSGMPIKDSSGQKIGAIAVADIKPREFSEQEAQILSNLARIVMDELKLRQFSMNEIKVLSRQVHEQQSKLHQTTTELERSQQELDNFLYRASHDLKGPISTMAGLLNLARQEITDTAAIGYVSKLALVNNNMNESLSKLVVIYALIRENGNGHLQKNILDKKGIQKMMDGILLNLKREADKKHIHIHASINEIHFFANHQYFQLVLANLVENAVHFHKKISGRLPEISIAVDRVGNNIELKVIDNGEGIPGDYQTKIFDLFFRGNNSARSGMGLYIVSKLIEKMNGSIKVESEYGEYTKFSVLLPMQ